MHHKQLHTTTSPLYAISASNDISAAMCDHGSGAYVRMSRPPTSDPVIPQSPYTPLSNLP